jgi:hypothetical protein
MCDFYHISYKCYFAHNDTLRLSVWGFGTRTNFNTNLSHFDAIYFALGTLTTVGAGTIEATMKLAA